MGLDMYLTGEAFYNYDHPARGEEQQPFPTEKTIYRIGYWRKHPNLHGHIVRTYGEQDEETGERLDNCEPIWLSQERLSEIIAYLEGGGELEETTGFFFGVSDNTPEERAADVVVFKRALEWLDTAEKGIWKDVYYRASW